MIWLTEVERANPGYETLTTATTFQISNAKLYVPVATLFIKDKSKFLKNIKQGFKRRFVEKDIHLK